MTFLNLVDSLEILVLILSFYLTYRLQSLNVTLFSSLTTVLIKELNNLIYCNLE